MAEFKIPEVGEGIESGTVVGILVKAGDALKKDQTVLELETDKAVVDVPSDVAGTVEEVRISEGDEVSIGQVVLIVTDNAQAGDEDTDTHENATQNDAAQAEEADDSTKQAAKQSATPANNKARQDDAVDGDAEGAVHEVTLPEVGEGISSGTIVSLLVAEGDTVAVDDAILELETDKAVVEMPSPVAGTVERVDVSEGEEASIGQVVVLIRSGGASTSTSQGTSDAQAQQDDADSKHGSDKQPTSSRKTDQQDAKASQTGHSTSRTLEGSSQAPQPYVEGARTVAAAPSVRRLARELGVDIQQVAGSGTLGRISASDVERIAKGETTGSQTAQAGAGVPAAFRKLPDFSKYGTVRREPMSAVRRATAKQMEVAWNVPRVTHHDKADITELESLRKSYQKRVERAGGGKLTPTAILAKVVAAALKVFPEVNASVDMDAQEIIYKDYINLGIAVDTPRGLLVPNIKGADAMNIIEISAALTELAEKARKGKTSLEDMQGSTFTITNLGGIGGTSFTPVVNHPEVAILGVSRGRYEAVYDTEHEEFVPRMLMPLSLSYDHRLVDGALAARFTRWVCEALENPLLVLLEG